MKYPSLQRMNPTGKLIINLFFLLAALFSSSFYTSLALLVFLILLGIGFRGFRWKHIQVLLPFCLFAFSLVWMNGLWGMDRDGELWNYYGLVFSVSGVEIGILLALRVLIIIFAGLLFTMSSPPRDLILSLMQQLSFPPGFSYAVLAVFNLFSDIKRDQMCLKASFRIRNSKGLNVLRSILPLLAINIRRCENISLAMEARGFSMNGKRTFYRRIFWRKSDTCFLVVCLLSIVIIYYVSFSLDLPIGYARWNGFS